MKDFAIECKIDYIYPDGKIESGQWMCWKKYKSIQSIFDAWNYWKNINWVYTSSQNGKILHKNKWYFRPIHNYN